MSITYKLTATETCEEREKIIRTREFKTCTGLNPKPGPGPGPAQDQELRPVSGPGPPEKAKARPVQRVYSHRDIHRNVIFTMSSVDSC